MGRGWIWISAAGLGVAVGACLIEPQVGIVCGDGFVDAEAGEECEPSLLSTYGDACRNVPGRSRGEASCNPQLCVVQASDFDCSICGDGIADGPDEDCDGNDFRTLTACPGNAGLLQCGADCKLDLSGCEACGNGTLDDPEECDRAAPGANDFASGISCTELAAPAKPYTSGTATMCRDDCTYNRIGCNYCGDGDIDTSTPIDYRDGVVRPVAQPEVCDSTTIPDDLGPFLGDPLVRTLVEHCDAEAELAGLTLRPDFGCTDDCSGFVPPTDSACCVPSGAACPGDGAAYRCCESDGGASCHAAWPGSALQLCGPELLPPLSPD